MMMRQVVSINWMYIGDAVPAFVTLMFIPFSYSIAYGLIA
jgi:adenine/guanine/hypoxanthine permease